MSANEAPAPTCNVQRLICTQRMGSDCSGSSLDLGSSSSLDMSSPDDGGSGDAGEEDPDASDGTPSGPAPAGGGGRACDASVAEQVLSAASNLLIYARQPYSSDDDSDSEADSPDMDSLPRKPTLAEELDDARRAILHMEGRKVGGEGGGKRGGVEGYQAAPCCHAHSILRVLCTYRRFWCAPCTRAATVLWR